MRESVRVLFGLAGFLITADLVALISAPWVVDDTDGDDADHPLTSEAAKLDAATASSCPTKESSNEHHQVRHQDLRRQHGRRSPTAEPARRRR